MCRLAVVLNNPTSKSIRNAIKEHLYSLEKAQGGDGNGIYLPYKNKVIKNLDIIPLLENDLTFPVLFHTRLASAGAVNKSNCHPFEMDTVVFAHNGCSFSFAFANGRTDSYNLFKDHLITKTPLDEYEWWGNIVMCDQDLIMFFIRGHLKVLILTDKTTVITSQKTGDLDPFIAKELTMNPGIYGGQFQKGPKGIKIHKISNIKKSKSPYISYHKKWSF